ncbi:hypothetical protein ECE50_020490 [Chitinophaga sp. Mgbs1]|uniref:Uncharacterized protein n=1 Tax=Chitinophaga solisilvae TaxID=1233460 RepID=A0A9Q5DDE0_9BACT|nr:hypothetical protein [Chitinophaga solisilvae]
MKKKHNARKITLRKMTVAPLSNNAQAAIKGGTRILTKDCPTFRDLTCLDCMPTYVSGCPVTYNCV